MHRTILGLTMAVTVAVVAVGFGVGEASAQTAPAANPGGPYAGVAGTAIQFNGTASTGAGLSYAWSFGDGATATDAAPVKAYAAAGIYTVTLTVTDVFGFQATASTTATISASSSVVLAANPGGPYSGVAGTAIQFSGTASSATAVSFFWSFGDGTSATGAAPVKAYVAAGVYTVTLTVTDSTGVQASASTTATISGASTQTCVVINGVLFCTQTVAPIVPTLPGVVAPGYPMPWHIG